MSILAERMTGEVFNLNGKVAGIIPAQGTPDATTFRVMRIHKARDGVPSWADFIIDTAEGRRYLARINPDVSQYRLYDLIATITVNGDKVLAANDNQGVPVTLQGERFILFRHALPSATIIMADTVERFRANNDTTAGDGQHRHGRK